MKLDKFVNSFNTFISNEEKEILAKLKYERSMHSFSDHDQFIIENLVRKNLVLKTGSKNPMVVINEF